MLAPRRFQSAAERHKPPCRLLRGIGLSPLAMAWFALLQRIQAVNTILPQHQVFVAPMKTQPKLIASYGRLLRRTKARMARRCDSWRSAGATRFLSSMGGV